MSPGEKGILIKKRPVISKSFFLQLSYPAENVPQ